MQVNHRYVRTTTPEALDALVAELRDGRREDEIPPHGTLIRVRRSGGLRATRAQVAAEREAAQKAREARAAQETK